MRTRAKKAAFIALGVLLALAVLVLAAGGILFRKELSTIASIAKEKPNFYTIDYKADYGLDEFMVKGASTDVELTEFIVSKLMKGLPINIEIPDLGCSAFQAKTPEGEYLFGRNFDNDDAIYALVHTDPENGYESISMINLSYIGYGGDYLPEGIKDSILALAAPYIPLDGINEKGLSIGVLQLSMEPTNQNTDKPDITTTSAIRMILDKAATVEEAIALLMQYDMHSSANAPYHFQIADAHGDSATIEYIDDELCVYRESEGRLCTTNFVLTPGEYFNDGIGQDRWQILREGLDAKGGVLTADEAMALLQAVAQDKVNEEGVFSGTLWSCVYNNTDCTLRLCCNLDYEKVYEYSVDWN